MVGPKIRRKPSKSEKPGARHEDPDGRQEGPEEALLAVAEGVLGVGRALPQCQREEQEHLVHGVGDRVGRLGQHGRRPRDEAGGELGHRDRRVGDQRDDHRAARGALRPPPADISASRCARRSASVTRAAIRRLVSSASGCHWTPSAKRRSGASKASGSSSMDDQPVTSRPSPMRSTAWWWWDFVACDDLARGAGGQRAVGQAHVVVGAVEAARVAPVLVVAVALGQVLQQRAARGDVHDLHAAADAQQRHVALEGAAGERDLEVVALGHGAASLGMGLRPVGRRIDVGAAGQDEPVEQVEDRVGVVLRALVGRQQQREPAGALDGVDVGARQQDRPAGPRRSSARAPARCRSR